MQDKALLHGTDTDFIYTTFKMTDEGRIGSRGIGELSARPQRAATTRQPQ